MTGGWRGESARHALAAKGIPTVATRIARGYHTARALDDRVEDEARTEPYVEDIALWAKNPDEYDLKGVDDPVPEGYEIERDFLMLDQGKVEMWMKEKDQDIWIGNLELHYTGKAEDVEYYSFSLHMDKNYRSLGLSRYLMRNMVNLADDMQVGLVGTIAPSSDSLDSDILSKYYASFGFRNATRSKDHNYFDIVRPPQPKEGVWNE